MVILDSLGDVIHVRRREGGKGRTKGEMKGRGRENEIKKDETKRKANRGRGRTA